MNKQNRPYDDLTIYDAGIDIETDRSFGRLKQLFDFFAAIYYIILIPSCLLLYQYMGIVAFAISAYMISVAYFSIAYVHYPKSKAARSMFCFLILAIYVILNLIF